MKNVYLKFLPTPKYPKLQGSWKERTLFKLEGDFVMIYDNGQWSETKWPSLIKAIEAARSIGFKVMSRDMPDVVLQRKMKFADDEMSAMPTGVGSDAADALNYMMPKYQVKFAGWKPDQKECTHEPMEYIGFNTVQTICKKCDKTLA